MYESISTYPYGSTILAIIVIAMIINYATGKHGLYRVWLRFMFFTTILFTFFQEEVGLTVTKVIENIKINPTTAVIVIIWMIVLTIHSIISYRDKKKGYLVPVIMLIITVVLVIVVPVGPVLWMVPYFLGIFTAIGLLTLG